MSYLSDFPGTLDEFTVPSDIAISDIENMKEYKRLMNMTPQEIEDYPVSNNDKLWQDRVDELAILLDGKILKSSDIAKLQNAILNMQEYILIHNVYVSDTPPSNPPTSKLWVDTN